MTQQLSLTILPSMAQRSLAVAALTMLMATSAMAADVGLGSSAYYDDADVSGTARARSPYSLDGYTDLRLTYLKISPPKFEPTFGSNGKFDSAYRIGVSTMGPICSIIPINCFTPSRLGSGEDAPSIKTWGDKDWFNFIGGMELSYNKWSKGNTLATPGGLEMTAYVFTAHMFGLAMETRCPGGACGVRGQFELNPFIGLGYSTVDWKRVDKTSDLYYEYGVRGAAMATWRGLQAGVDLRYLVGESKASLSNPAVAGNKFKVSAAAYGIFLGYRF